MPQCPVCDTRFINGKTVQCPICAWDIQDLSLVVGLIPEVAEKEATRLAWARKMWQTTQQHQSQLQLTQAQLKLAQEQLQSLASQPPPPPTQESLAPTPLPPEVPPIQSPDRIPPTDSPPLVPSPVDAAPLLVASVEHPLPERAPEPPVPQMATVHSHPTATVGPEPDEAFNEWLLAPPVLTRLRPIALPPLHPSCTPKTHCFESVTLTPQGRQVQQLTATAFDTPLSAEVNLELVVLPGGQFWMGSPDTETERDPNEGPRHQVTIAPLSMSKFPITQAQWRIVASWPKVNRSLSLYPADFEGDDRPVEQVTWYDCMEFCARLSQYTGQTYRLPSEAEWEYACRAGTTTPFHWGETLAPDLANYDGNYTYGSGPIGLYRQQTTPIHTFRYTNAFGLFDLHGNVWEWCLDSWHDSYQDAPGDGRAWEDADQPYRVLRGGAWYCLPGLCRSAQRHWNQPDTGGSGIGLRVVCEIN